VVLRRYNGPSVGQLSARVLLQSKAQTATGGTGGTGMAEAYTTVGKAWCAVEQLRGGRYVAGKQVEEVATHRITMRHRDDYPLWRYLLAGTRRYRVLSVADPDDGQRWLEVLAEEMTP
jgi:SPP1 family predicted phage head-tail adaptor